MARINVFNVYPELNGDWYELYDYEPMVSAFGQRTLVLLDDNDYQGDSFRLIADGAEPDERYGLLTFGWGSCSGCDALQGCRSVEEVQELADSLHDGIKWFSDKEALKKYMLEHDWEGDWSWHSATCREFRRMVMEFLDSDGS